MAPRPRLEAYHFYEQDWDSYEQLYEEFEWEIPDEFNKATYVCDRWADDEDRTALIYRDTEGNEQTYTFRQLRDRANRFANFLADQGVERNDRIGIVAPQKPETAIAHLACWKLGAVPSPLSTLFGPDALHYRLDDAGSVACVVDEGSIETFREVRSELPALETTVTVDVADPTGDEIDFGDAIADRSPDRETATTVPDDDGLLLYTSGTTGDPKGVRHGHRFLIGLLPSIVMWPFNNEVNDDDVFYSPATWAWAASMYILWGPWYYGRPVVAYSGQFDPERDLKLLEEYDVTNYVAVPTAIRQLMGVEDIDRFDLSSLRVIPSAGEAVTPSIIEWVDETLDDTVVNVGYGQTEALGLISECGSLIERKIGTLGKAVPGHEMAIVDPETAEPIDDPDTVGEIALRYETDPGYFKEYWNKPERTAEVRRNGWHLTGDMGTIDEDGYYSFVGRKDDVIISAGYRIGPEEVEDTLSGHNAVADAGVIGIPDEERGEVPKAFVVLNDGYDPTEALRDDLRQFVRDRLAKYEYPREVEFIDELPKTVTDKVRRVALRRREGLDE